MEPSLHYISISKVDKSSFDSPTIGSEQSSAKLKKHIEREGILQTLLVRQKEEGYEVVDGNRRLSAAQDLEKEKVPCAVIECGTQKAIALSMALNTLNGQIEPGSTVTIFRGLKGAFSENEDEGLDDEEIKELFPEKLHKQIQRFLELVKIVEKEPREEPKPSMDEEDKADLEEHATTGPFHKQFRYQKESHREEVTEIVEKEKKEGENVGFTLLRLLRSLDSSKTRTHEEGKEE